MIVGAPEREEGHVDEVRERPVDVAHVAVVDLPRARGPSATYWKIPWSRPSGVRDARSVALTTQKSGGSAITSGVRSERTTRATANWRALMTGRPACIGPGNLLDPRDGLSSPPSPQADFPRASACMRSR